MKENPDTVVVKNNNRSKYIFLVLIVFAVVVVVMILTYMSNKSISRVNSGRPQANMENILELPEAKKAPDLLGFVTEDFRDGVLDEENWRVEKSVEEILSEVREGKYWINIPGSDGEYRVISTNTFENEVDIVANINLSSFDKGSVVELRFEDESSRDNAIIYRITGSETEDIMVSAIAMQGGVERVIKEKVRVVKNPIFLRLSRYNKNWVNFFEDGTPFTVGKDMFEGRGRFVLSVSSDGSLYPTEIAPDLFSVRFGE